MVKNVVILKAVMAVFIKLAEASIIKLTSYIRS
jgi:hypothetical protein